MTARFKVRELLSRLQGPRRRRAPIAPPLTQVLETRVLPAGNVNVRIAGDTLVINGNRDDNSVSLIVDNGNLVVHGLDDTTINGGEDDFVVAEGSATFDGRVIVRLGSGNDTFAVGEGVEINGRLTVEDFFGDETISIDSATINGGLGIYTFFGDDSVRLNGTTISGRTNIFTGFGDDLVVIDGVETSAFFKISTGPGDDGLDTDGNTFNGRFVVKLGLGADDANFDGDNVDEDWVVKTKNGDDAVRATGMTVEGSTLLSSTGGDDNVLFEDTNELTGRVIGLLGRGEDNLQFSDDTNTAGGVTKRDIEGDETDDSVFSSRFDASSTGLLARADALRLKVDGALQINLNPIAGTTQSNGVLLTKNQQLTVTGTTHAGAIVTVDADADGQFDDGTITANDDGTFSLNVTLPSNVAGTMTVKFRSSFGGTTANAERKFDIVQGTIVRFATTLGNYDVELFNTDAPATVSNFLNYLGRYSDSIIHRSEHEAGGVPFIIQGGGFVNPPDVVPIATDAPVANEFSSAHSNVRGTLAMALPSNNINGGTSQWFINAGNNSGLDAGKYTVFGKVLGDGMTVVDSIHALTSFNLVGPTGETALANVPLKNYTPFTETLAGTASVTSGSTTVTGVGTNFLTDLKVNEAVKIGNVEGIVASITNNTTFTLALAANATVTGGQVKKNALPAEASYVTLNTVSTLSV